MLLNFLLFCVFRVFAAFCWCSFVVFPLQFNALNLPLKTHTKFQMTCASCALSLAECKPKAFLMLRQCEETLGPGTCGPKHH